MVSRDQKLPKKIGTKREKKKERGKRKQRKESPPFTVKANGRKEKTKKKKKEGEGEKSVRVFTLVISSSLNHLQTRLNATKEGQQTSGAISPRRNSERREKKKGHREVELKDRIAD